jgi:aldehyde dehydrogenase (NAD+)
LEPVGVAGLITAWNANPLFICLKLASAVAAGCTVVIKPSELSSLQTQVMLECLNAAELPKGVYNVVTGRGDVVGAELVRNPDVAKISFTGSVAVGEPWSSRTTSLRGIRMHPFENRSPQCAGSKSF